MDDRLEITKNDLFVTGNKKAFAAGKMFVNSHNHEVVIQRKGCKRLIRLKSGDRMFIQSK